MKKLIFIVCLLFPTLIYAQQTGVGYQPSRNTPYTLAVSHLTSTITGTTGEVILSSIVIPANTLEINGTLRMEGIYSVNSSTYTKIFRSRIAGQNLMYGTAAAPNTGFLFINSIRNMNNLSSQFFCSTGGGYGANLCFSSNINMQVNNTIEITCQLSISSDICVLKGFEIYITN